MALVIPPNAVAVMFSKCREMNTMGIPMMARTHDQGYGSKTQLPHTIVSLVHMYAGAKRKPTETATSVTAMVNVKMPNGNFRNR